VVLRTYNVIRGFHLTYFSVKKKGTPVFQPQALWEYACINTNFHPPELRKATSRGHDLVILLRRKRLARLLDRNSCCEIGGAGNSSLLIRYLACYFYIKYETTINYQYFGIRAVYLVHFIIQPNKSTTYIYIYVRCFICSQLSFMLRWVHIFKEYYPSTLLKL
jgi:hypothetical protein